MRWTSTGSRGELFSRGRYDGVMNPDKPVHADNVPTPTPPTLTRGQATPEQIDRQADKVRREQKSPNQSEPSIRLEAESELKAEAESRPVSGTEPQPNQDEAGQPSKTRTTMQDPSESAVQTRSDTTEKTQDSAGKLRNQ